MTVLKQIYTLDFPIIITPENNRALIQKDLPSQLSGVSGIEIHATIRILPVPYNRYYKKLRGPYNSLLTLSAYVDEYPFLTRDFISQLPEENITSYFEYANTASCQTLKIVADFHQQCILEVSYLEVQSL